MKKIFLSAALMALATLTGCERFLDTKNLTKQDTSNYPQTEAQVQELLTGVYRMAREAEIAPTRARGGFVMSEIMADDCLAAAGSTAENDTNVADFERFIDTEDNFFEEAWNRSYQTIFRANTMIEGLSRVEWQNPAARDYAEAQGLFLRSYVLFFLARMFGTVPMPLGSAPVNLPRASADEIFGRVAADLHRAISLMPSTPRHGDIANKGRATKWAAEAMLARVFLFYTGYYGRTEIAMADGGTLTKDMVIAHLDDCIANSGHRLMPNFYSLWPYSNEVTRANGGYRWLDSVDPDKQVTWAGERGGNEETVFAWQFGTTAAECNRALLYLGMRMIEYSPNGDTQTRRTFPFGVGWGFCTVNPRLWENWPTNDPRRKGSIIDMNDPLETAGYIPGADYWQQETGFMQKKYMPIVFLDNAEGTLSGVPNGMVNISQFYNPTMNASDYQGQNNYDQVIMRFADVLLMAAELKQDASPLNQVRARVGLPPVAYSEEALRNERRWELCFEGIRWFDLLRYGLDYAAAALDTQNAVPVTNSNAAQPGTAVTNEFNRTIDHTAQLSVTGGFFPIPQYQIDLSGGVLTQTPGWAKN
jgi:hypothetical protein